MQRPSSPVDSPNLLHRSSDSPSSQQQTLFSRVPALPPRQNQTSSYPQVNMAAAVSLLPPMLSSHQPSSERRQDLPRPYRCPLCDRAFHRLEHQTRHIRTHTGERPHACSFPGCTKRFSRSDELTRHSRIHNNPNSRRNNRAHQIAVAAAAAGVSDGPNAMAQAQAHAQMMPPPTAGASRSAPPSGTGSPNVSPPQTYSLYSPNIPTTLGPYNHRSEERSNVMDINMLATAATQVERGGNLSASAPSRPPPSLSGHHPGSTHRFAFQAGSGRLPSLSAYAISHSMARSHSDTSDDQAHRVKRSRPNSPNSTAPPSPSFSHDSLSPTPDHTPLATPAHSPRLRPYGHPDLQLPGIRNLSLGHAPALPPLEPAADVTMPSIQHLRPTISGMASRQDALQRRLPIPQGPKMTVQDVLNPRQSMASDL